MTAWENERVIEARARTQHGAFSDRQAGEAGFTAAMIRRRVRNGRWTRLDRGALAVAGSPPTFERQVMAATLTVPHGAASRTTAAVLHGFSGFRPGRIHVVTAMSDKHTGRLATVHRSKLAEVTAVAGIPVVTPAHCLIELAGITSARRVRAALHDAIARDRHLLGAFTERYVDVARSRLPGIGVVRALLDELGDGARPTESELERSLLAVLAQVPGLPTTLVQSPPPWWPDGTARVDVTVPAWLLIVEADGRAWHTRVDDFERDRWRDNEAAVHGYHVMRFTHPRLTGDVRGVIDQLVRYGRRFTRAA